MKSFQNSNSALIIWCIKNIDFLGLFAIIILNTILVFLTITVRSVWLDEAYSYTVGNMSLSALIQSTAADVHPPLYYIILGGWMNLFGTSEIAIRSLSYFFGVGLLIAVFLFVRQQFNRYIAYLSTFLISITPVFIRYQQEARMYTLLPFLLILTFIFTIQWVQSGLKWKKGVLPVIFASASIYTHNYGLFGLIAIYITAAIYSFLLSLPGKKKGITKSGEIVEYFQKSVVDWKIYRGYLFRMAISGALILIIYVPWISVLITQKNTADFFWLSASFRDLFVHLLYCISLFPCLISEEQIFWFVFFITLITVGLIFSWNSLARLRFRGYNRYPLKNENTYPILAILLFIVSSVFFLIPYQISVTERPFGYSIFAEKYVLFSVIISKILIAYLIYAAFTPLKKYFQTQKEKQQMSRSQDKNTAVITIAEILEKPYFAIAMMVILTAFMIHPIVHFTTVDAEENVMYRTYDNQIISEAFSYVYGDYRSAAQFIISNSWGPTPVFIDADYCGQCFEYYFDPDWDAMINPINYTDGGSSSVINAIETSNLTIFWYVYSHEKDWNWEMYNYFQSENQLDLTFWDWNLPPGMVIMHPNDWSIKIFRIII